MSSTSSIEWTDASLSLRKLIDAMGATLRENKPVHESGRWSSIRRFEPLNNIFVLLGTIAGSARWNYVAWRRDPINGDGVNMIPCGSIALTIGALAVKLFKYGRLPYGRDWLYTTLAGMGMLFSLAFVGWIVGVSLAILFIDMKPALSLMDFGYWQPVLTSTAISQSQETFLTPFSLSRFVSCVLVPTVLAYSVIPISTRLVYSKCRDFSPVLPFVTPFFPSVDVSHVLFERKSNTLRRNLDDACLASHYSPRMLCVTLVHSILSNKGE